MRLVLRAICLVFSLLATVSTWNKNTCGDYEEYDDTPKYPFEGEPHHYHYPWIGVLYHQKSEGTLEYACGCTLISAEYVITARICVSDENGYILDRRDVFVRMGTHENHEPQKPAEFNYNQWLRYVEQWNETQKKLPLNMTKIMALVLKNNVNIDNAQYRHVMEIHQPVDFDKTSKNELVILELSYKVEFGRYVKAICIRKNFNVTRPDAMIGWNAVDGEKHLEKFKKAAKTCSPNTITTFYNQSQICNKDRGSIGISEYGFRKWYIEGIIDCAIPPFVPCKKQPNFKTVALIQMSDYILWIKNVTSLTYTQVELHVQDETKSEIIGDDQGEKIQCGQRTIYNPEENIKNHELDPYPGQWPWYGAIYHRKPDRTVEYACGGTLISKKHVLTARICATNETGLLVNPRNVFVGFGSHMQNFLNFGYAQHRHVAKIHEPVDFDKTSKNEIVILTLSDEVKLNNFVQPICIPVVDKFVSFKYFQKNIMIGWGAIDGKRFVEQKSYNFKRCSGPHPIVWFYNQTEICKKDRGTIIITDENLLISIIDCTKPMKDPCELEFVNEYVVNFNIINNFKIDRQWIVHVTGIDYFKKIRKGKKFDQSKRYPRLLPRLSCGLSLAKQNDGDPNAVLYKHPWIATIFSDERAKHFGGTLISHYYILTTANAFFYMDDCNIKNLKVELGENKLHQEPNCTWKTENECILPSRVYYVEYVVVHQNHRPPSYSEFSTYNIALIRTKKAVLFEDHIHPVCLPTTQKLQQMELSEYILVQRNLSHPNNPFRELPVYKQNCTVKTTSRLCIFDLCDRINRRGAPLGQFIQSYYGERFVQFGVYDDTMICDITIESLLFVKVAHFMNWIIANMEN